LGQRFNNWVLAIMADTVKFSIPVFGSGKICKTWAEK